MATDYDFSDDFTSAQYLPPGRGPILIEYNPPPLPPQRPSLRDLFYPATPPHIDQQIPGFVFGRFLLAFLHDCSVLISDCWHRRVKIRSIVSLAVCAVVVFVIRKGMWDVAVLKSELGEAKRQLWQVQENLFQYIRASGPVSSSCASTITASNTNNDHQPTTQQRTYSKLSQYQLNMPIYSLLAQLPYLISVIILTLIFEHIIKRYLNTIRKIKYALRIVATNIGITYLLYVVVTNMLEVAEMKRQLEMEDQNMNMNERCFAGDWKADLAEGLRVCK
ncbi:hypothetical protein J4E80_010813 [Alternaria sp. BMP 0032]|nr:hypothetical protein J4E80_010813 [Alternaria sp. BMP 0032]